jgi:hypothetical protein
MKIEIHACPFCDHDDVEVDEVSPGRYAICCPECGCVGPVCDDVSAAVEAWNRPHGRDFSLERAVREAREWGRTREMRRG